MTKMGDYCRELTVRMHKTDEEAEKDAKFKVVLTNGVRDLTTDNKLSVTITSAASSVFDEYPLKEKFDLRIHASGQTKLKQHDKQE